MATDARQTIFDNIRTALAPLKERAAYPEFDTAATIAAPRATGGDVMEVFERNLKAVNGRLFRDVATLAAFLAEQGHYRGYCDPAYAALVVGPFNAAGMEIVTEFDRADYESYGFGITRGTAAIAESGSIVLDDNKTSDRLAALAPWVHIALLTPAEIVPTIAEAVTQLGTSPNTIWCTGPSKTADVEGILIEGVHGPGEQIALILPAL